MKFCMLNNLAIVNTFVHHIVPRYITHSAINSNRATKILEKVGFFSIFHPPREIVKSNCLEIIYTQCCV